MRCACGPTTAREVGSPRKREVGSPRKRVVRVTGYGVQGASHDAAHDGSVRVRTDPVCAALSVLWSTGGVVDADVLENVRPGLYAAWVLSADGVAVDCLHACAPARVGVAEDGARELRT